MQGSRNNRRKGAGHRKLLSLAVAACFAAEFACANPTAPVVVRGQASFATQGNKLTVTNSPGAIINWQSFSIPSQNITQFMQQSAASAVLNRVTGATPSAILGQLQSNGRVFLINPNGITIGQGAVIDVAGFVASSLNLSDADFVAGRHRFTETPGAGAVVNQGTIKTSSGGMVYLVGQNIENHGIIKSPQGEIILAAGKSIELVDAGTPEIRVQVTAPDNQAVNLGQLLASGGRIGMYAGLVRQGGTANANTAVVGENGKIVFKAVKDVKLDAGSVTTASGPTAGSITVEAQTGSATVAGTVEANATAGRGGSIDISGQQGVTIEATGRISANGVEGGSITLNSPAGSVQVAGQVSAEASAGHGGRVAIAAATQASIAEGARVSASGAQAGGSVNVKGNDSVKLESGSEIVAEGASGGTVEISAAAGSVEAGGLIDVSGSESAGGSIAVTARVDLTLGDTSALLARGSRGGTVYIEAREGTALVSGLIDAFGRDGPGGQVLLLGPRVGLIRNARVNVSGRRGGGVALVGGDFQGSNPDVPNAERTYVGADARITADAIETGDGGKVIVWADGDTRYHGLITARGGAQSGKGGFVEVSGKEILNFYGQVDVGASSGLAGTILLDPRDIVIQNADPGADDGQIADSTILFADGTATTDYTISDEALEGLTGNIVLQASRDININAGLSGGGLVLVNQVGGERVVLQAGRHIIIDSPVMTNGAAIWLEADTPHSNGFPVTGTTGSDGKGAVRINAAVQSFGADGITTETSGGKITLIAGTNTQGGTNGGGFELNANVSAGAGGIDVALSTQATGELSFLIGSAGQAQFTTDDTGQLLSTGQLKIGEATTAGTDGLGANALTIKVDQLTIGSTAGGPVTLADTAGTSLVFTAGDGGILVDRPLDASQSTSIETTGALTINQTITTNGEPLSITAASVSGVGNIAGTFTCSGTGCPGTIVVLWDGGGDGTSWFDQLNWAGDVVPTSSTAVEIPFDLLNPGTILISNGAAVAKSLIADRPLSISNTGSLSLVEASQFTQGFTLSGSLLGTGVVAVNGSSGVLTWNGGTMGTGGSFTLGVGSSGTLSGTLTLNREFQNSSALTLSGVTVGGTGSILNAGAITAAFGTSNAVNVALSNPSNSLIQVLGSLTVASFPTNDGQIMVGNTATFSTNGTSLANSSSSSIVIEGGNYSTADAAVTTDGSGNLTVVSGTLDAGTIILLAGGSVTLSAGTTITASGIDDSIVISGASFTNNSGSSVLDPGAGRWLVYTANPASNTFGGLNSGNQALWGRSYPTAVAEAGNRYAFSTQPTLTFTSTNAVKTYGDAADVSGNYSVTGFVDASLYGGVFTQDTALNTFTGAPSVTSAGAAATAHRADGDLGLGLFSINVNVASVTATTGYALAVSSTGQLTVDPKALTVTAPTIGGTTTKVYDGNTTTAATLIGGSVSGAIAGDTLTLDTGGVTLAYDNAHVASVTKISASGSATLNIGASTAGSLASDYSFTAPTISDHVAANLITAKALTVTAPTIGGTTTKVYDGNTTTAATLIGGSVSGAIAGDTLTLDTGGVTLAYDNAHVASVTKISASGSATLNIGASTAGSLASDYSFTAPTISDHVAANLITAKALTVTAPTIGGTTTKVYDGNTTTAATLIGGSVSGAIAGDTLTLDTGGVTLAYDNAHVASVTKISASGSATLNIGASTAGSLASDYSFTAPTISDHVAANLITAKALTVTAPTIGGTTTKVYDGNTTTAATLIGGSVSGAIAGDTLTLDTGGVTLAYDNAHVASVTKISASGSATLNIGASTAGSLASDYSFTAPTISDHVAANLITAKALTVTAPTIGGTTTKVYDGNTTTAATLIGGSVSGAIAGDTLTLDTGGVTLAYDNAHVASVTKISASGSATLNIGASTAGSLASDYSFTAPTISDHVAANLITAKALTVTAPTIGGTTTKVYDGNTTTAATLIGGSVSGAIAGDTLTLDTGGVTLAYDNAHVASVTKISASGSATLNIGASTAGSLASDYSFTAPTISDHVAANLITAKALTVTAPTIGGTTTKVYDGNTTTAATLIGGSVSGAIAGDTLTLDTGGVTLAYDNAHVASVTKISASGSATLNIGASTAGSLASDYSFTAPTISDHVAANLITAKALTVTAPTIGGTTTKVYDGNTTTAATLIGGSVSGAIAGDTLTLDTGGVTLAYDNAHVASVTKISASGSATLNIGASTAGSLASDYSFTAPTISDHVAANLITAKALTVTAPTIGGTTTKVYDGNTTTAATLIGGSVSGAIAGDTLTLDTGGVTLAYDNAHVASVTKISASGSATLNIGASTAGSLASDYSFTAPTISDHVAANLITAKALTVTAPTIGGTTTKVYDGNTTTAATLIGGSVSGAIAGDTLTLDTGGVTLAYDNAHVASVTKISASGSATLNIGASTAGSLASDYSFTAPTISDHVAANLITAKALTVTAPTIGGTTTKVYDGNTTTAATLIGGSVSGAIAGDTLTLDTGGVTLAYDNAHVASVTKISASGSATLNIGASTAGSLASDYSFTAPTISDHVAANLITAKALTVTAPTIGGTTTKVYDGNTTTAATLIGGSVSGAIAGDTLTLDTGGVTLAYDNAHVASVTKISASGSATLNIGASTAGSLASDYSFTAPTISDHVAANLITAKALTVTAPTIGGTTTKVYDGNTTTAATLIGGSVSGAIAGDTLTLDTGGVTLAYNSVNVADANQISASGAVGYTINSSAAGSLTTDYSFAAPTISSVVASITPVVLNLSRTRTYDGTTSIAAAIFGAISGGVGTETLTVSGSGTVASRNVGTQTLAGLPTLAGGTGLASNYTLAGGTHTVTITARPITIASQAGQVKIYGDDDPAAAKTAYALSGGTLLGSSDSLAGNMGRIAGEAVGSYAFTQGSVTVSDGNGGSNYTIGFNGAANPFQINSRSLTATIGNQSKTYGTSDPALAGIGVGLSDLVNRNVTDINGNVTPINDTVNVTAGLASLTRNAGENVGGYAITGGTVSALTGIAAGNYSGASLSTAGNTLTINPATLTASIADQTKTYAANDPAVGTIAVTLGGAVNTSVTDWNGNVTVINDAGSLTATLADLTRVPGENVGVYNVTGGTLGTITGGAASNYGGASLVTAGTTLEIVPPPPTAVLSPTVTTWDGTAPVDINFAWTANASGAWETGSNWSKGFAPVNGAVVTIPDIGAVGVTHTITYSGGITTVRTLTSFEALTLAGGTLNLGMTSADVSTIPLLTLTGGVLGGPGTVNVATLNLLAGVLNGTGTIVGNVTNTGGTVAPGASPGTLTINGDYMQGSGGTLAVEIGGTTAGTQYDQLVVTGNATLGGTLNVALVNGFVPASGGSFTVVQTGGTVSGVFAATNAPAAQPMTTSYLASSVNVLAQPSTVPDQIINTQINSSNEAPPTTNIETANPGQSGTGGPNLTGVYIETATGLTVPLGPASTIEAGTYINVNTGQTIIITSGVTPEPGIYLQPETLLVVVVSIDPVTGQVVIMTGSGDTNLNEAGVGATAQLRRPGVCK